MIEALKKTIRVVVVFVCFLILGGLVWNITQDWEVTMPRMLLFVVVLWTPIFIAEPIDLLSISGLLEVRRSLGNIEKNVEALPETILNAIANSTAKANASSTSTVNFPSQLLISVTGQKMYSTPSSNESEETAVLGK